VAQISGPGSGACCATAFVLDVETASTPVPRRIATRLTQSRKRAVKGSEVPSVKAPKPERVCRGCGKTLQGDSMNCAQCDVDIATKRLLEVARGGRVAGHTPEAIAKEAATHRRHAHARAAWNPTEQPGVFTENSTSAHASLGYGHRKEDWRIALVRPSDSRGIPSSSTALAGASATGWYQRHGFALNG
jgi:hypothetical protein